MAVMGCVLTQDGGRTVFTLIFCLIALRIASSEPVMPVFCSVLVQYQTFLIAVKQMHVVDSLGTVFSLRSNILAR